MFFLVYFRQIDMEMTKKKGRTSRYNGAFYYSREIVNNIIPNVKTDRNWVTIRVGDLATDHSIIFIHNNLYPGRYEFLKNYKDLILVCGVPETCEKVKHFGTPLYLPLSIDVGYVEQFKVFPEEQRGACFVGRWSKTNYEGVILPDHMDYICNKKRRQLLHEMARYKYVYAVGRTAIEAKILGCEVLPYDPRYPDPSVWKIIDNHDAAIMLQEKLDALNNHLV